MRKITRAILCGLLVAAAGCNEQLVVTNDNSPDRDRALARPTDVENLAAGQFRVINNTLWGTSIQPQWSVMAMESFSQNANFGMGVRSGIPRSLIDNSRGNPADFYGTWATLQQAARAEALALSKLNDPAFTFFPSSAAQVARDRAFAFFVKGVANGYIALAFDSGPVITANDDLEAPNLLVSYDSLMRFALADLDSAIAIASGATPAGANGFPIPTTWVNGVTTLTGGAAGGFVALVRGYKARFRAQVGRTPAERAEGGLNGLVTWASIIADAAAGPAADIAITMTNVTGGWSYRPMQMDLYQSWHQEWQGMVGMADTSGQYDTWLSTSRALKVPFNIGTPDRRFPAGATRAAQQTASGCTSTACIQPAATAPYPYFRNRPVGEDVAVDGLFHSRYDFYRFQAFWNANRNSPPNIPIMTRAEMDLLVAEGQIRAGNFGAAMTAINLSRQGRGNLPALAGIATINDLVAGPNCVPRVPVGATVAANDTPAASACGNIMEAMKYEKRLETMFTAPGAWFYDGRGWGDLPVGTPVQFPVPYTELDARHQPIYSQPTTVAGAASYSAAERFSNSAPAYGYGN